jgi:glycosyltransferase involved in cell wall biosynthesis
MRMAMTRVYLINLGFRLAGVERRFANIWRALRARGRVEPILVIPDVLARNLRGAGLLPADTGGIIEVRVPTVIADLVNRPVFRFGELPRAVLQSRVVARQYRPIWQHLMQDAGAVLHFGIPCAALTPPDMPAVLECMDATLGSFRNSHYRRASKRAVIVHCQTERIRRALSHAYAGEETRWCLVAGRGYFADYRVPPLVMRKNNQVVFVGRFESIKNPLLFIDALAIATQQGTDCRAVMLGEGPLRSEMEAAILRHGLQSRVEIRFDTRPLATLAESAVYVSLQTSDNFGSQALLEAMGAGCAVIATDVGETSRLITTDVGMVVPPVAEAVAAAIVESVTNLDQTRARGDAASHRAQNEYSADAYAASLETLYSRAAALHAGESPYESDTALDRTAC